MEPRHRLDTLLLANVRYYGTCFLPILNGIRQQSSSLDVSDVKKIPVPFLTSQTYQRLVTAMHLRVLVLKSTENTNCRAQQNSASLLATNVILVLLNEEASREMGGILTQDQDADTNTTPRSNQKSKGFINEVKSQIAPSKFLFA